MSTLSTLEVNSLKGALEALLLVSSDPVSAPALGRCARYRPWRMRIAARRAQG